MEVLTRASFKGTKKSHKKVLDIELRQDNGVWHVVLCGQGGDTGIQMYEGKNQGDAERIFLNGFCTYIADEYVLNCEDEMTMHMAFEAFTRMVQAVYIKILIGMGYSTDGLWEIRSFLAGAEEGKVDRIGMVMMKQKPRRWQR